MGYFFAARICGRILIGKTARVRAEMVVNQAATDRGETVRDTVRREDVEITFTGPAAHDAEHEISVGPGRKGLRR
jgi:stress response protein YsnF